MVNIIATATQTLALLGATAVAQEITSDPLDVYIRAHSEVFGRPPRGVRGRGTWVPAPKDIESLARATHTSHDLGIDFGVYCRANMEYLRQAPRVRKYGFQTVYLSSAGGAERASNYNRRQKDHTKTDRSDGLARRTQSGTFLQAIIYDEGQAALDYVCTALGDNPRPFLYAQELRSPEWRVYRRFLSQARAGVLADRQVLQTLKTFDAGELERAVFWNASVQVLTPHVGASVPDLGTKWDDYVAYIQQKETPRTQPSPRVPTTIINKYADLW